MGGMSGGGGISPRRNLGERISDLMKENPRKLLKILWTVTGVYLLLFVPGLYNYWTLLQTAKWPSVPGIIIRSQTKESPKKGGWFPDVNFEYSVNGHDYIGNRTCNLVHWAAKDPTENYVKQFPLGATMPVYYDPTAPENSLLQPGPTEEQRLIAHWVSPIAAGFVLLCAIVMTWDIRRVINKRETRKTIG